MSRLFCAICSGVSGVILFTCVSAVNATAALPANLKPLTDEDFRQLSEQRVKVGRLLFYDKLLSGNRNIACATCHHPEHASGDGLSLGIGEGGSGLGPERSAKAGDIKHLVPRNAPALFNLGAKQFDTLFHDGRLSVSNEYSSGFNSPAEEFLPEGLNSIVSAQALFPLVSSAEMAGDISENEVAGAVRRRVDYAWRIITERVRKTGNYEKLLREAYPEIHKTDEISIVHIVNAIGDFIAFEWRSDGSPFDAYLRGNPDALTTEQRQGMLLFYGKAQCSTCHSGALQTDHQFHALALPQFGPGRTRRFDWKSRDMGRINETDRLEDAYRFRTPSLRNIAFTGPYGHNGAYASLEGIIRHHADPEKSFANFDNTFLTLPESGSHQSREFIIQQDKQEQRRLKQSYSIQPVELNDEEIDLLVAFLGSLGEPDIVKGRLGIPDSVPSGLPIDRPE